MLWACANCTARYSPGAPACPHCGSTQYRDAPGGDIDENAPVLDSAPAASLEVPAGTPAEAPAKTKPKAADPPAAETAT